MNARLFSIGIFPWTMIVTTAVFFDTDWPRRAVSSLIKADLVSMCKITGGFVFGFFIGGFLPTSFSPIRAIVGGLGLAIAAFHVDEPFRSVNENKSISTSTNASAFSEEEKKLSISESEPGFFPESKVVYILLGAWVLLQILVPLRHFIISGNVHWTEEGHNYSWHMKLRDKESAGFFIITDATTKEQWIVDPQDYLTPKQTEKMTSRPGLVIQFVQFLEQKMKNEGYEAVEIRARVIASLNGREFQPLIDPQSDLTKVSYPWFRHARWILPLMVPLPERNE